MDAHITGPDRELLARVGGFLYARGALQGEEIWQFRAGGAIMASPLIIGPRVYFGADDGFLYALDRSQGALLWKLAFGAPIHAPPVFASGHLYIRTRDGRLHAVQ